MKLAQAKSLAEKVVHLLAPACARIEIAGSIRRERPEVGDIDIVLQPVRYTGEAWLPRIIDELTWPGGKLVTNGASAKRLLLRKCGVQVDLWIAHNGKPVDGDLFEVGPVLPPNFGALMTNFTGSLAHNTGRLIPAAKARGWEWKPFAGIVVPGATAGAAPAEIIGEDEREIFRRLFGGWIEPKNREL